MIWQRLAKVAMSPGLRSGAAATPGGGARQDVGRDLGRSVGPPSSDRPSLISPHNLSYRYNTVSYWYKRVVSPSCPVGHAADTTSQTCDVEAQGCC